MAYSSYLYLSDAFGLWQRCDAQQYPVTPKLGKALFGNAVMPSSTQFIPELGKALSGNAVMPSSTQFIPELGKALSGNAVMPSSTQFIPELGKALSRKCNKQTYKAILPRGLLRASPRSSACSLYMLLCMPPPHAAGQWFARMLPTRAICARFQHRFSAQASASCTASAPVTCSSSSSSHVLPIRF